MNATSTKNESNLWAGQGNEQQTGDDSGNAKTVPVTPSGSFNRQKQEINYTAPVVVKNTATSSPVFTPAADIDFGAIIANNKWLIIGALGLVGYLLYSGSLAADDRTVTSVTRYSARKKK